MSDCEKCDGQGCFYCSACCWMGVDWACCEPTGRCEEDSITDDDELVGKLHCDGQSSPEYAWFEKAEKPKITTKGKPMNTDNIVAIRFDVGQRVAHDDGSIGIIENEHGDNDGRTSDVRWLTPNNELSCCVSLCDNECLTHVPDSVVPTQKNKEWWGEAKALHSALEKYLQTFSPLQITPSEPQGRAIMTEAEFKKQYLCEWNPDPVMKEVVEFVRYATDGDIRRCKRDGLITRQQEAMAKLIIEQEATQPKANEAESGNEDPTYQF